MMIGLVTVLFMMQSPTAPPSKTIGPPNPDVPQVVRTGDGVVLGAIGAADANIIEAATLAGTKATDAAVRTLAADSKREHEKSLTASNNLAKQFSVNRLLPNDSTMARLQTTTMKQLNRLSGSAFDQLFVEYMVDLHKRILARERGPIAAESVRPEVKALLDAHQATVLTHLQAGERWLLR